MPQPWTSKLIIKALGVQKCNGSMDAATEDLPLEKAIEVLSSDDVQAAGAKHLGLAQAAKLRDFVGGHGAGLGGSEEAVPLAPLHRPPPSNAWLIG